MSDYDRYCEEQDEANYAAFCAEQRAAGNEQYMTREDEEALIAEMEAPRHAAASMLARWVRRWVLPRPRSPKAEVDRMDPSHTDCPACAGPLSRAAPTRDVGYLFVALCLRCGWAVGDGKQKVVSCGDHLREGAECDLCVVLEEGCDCDACCAYANTPVEMRCEWTPPTIGDHAEKYSEYLRRVASQAEASAGERVGAKRAAGGSSAGEAKRTRTS